MTKTVMDRSHKRVVWPQQKHNWNLKPDPENISEEFTARKSIPTVECERSPKVIFRSATQSFPVVDTLKSMTFLAVSKTNSAALAIKAPDICTTHKQDVWKDITDLAPRALFRKDRGYKLLDSFTLDNGNVSANSYTDNTYHTRCS